MKAYVNSTLRSCIMEPTFPIDEGAGWVEITDPAMLAAWYESLPPLPPQPVVLPIPDEITNRQFRLALRRVRGIYPTDVTAAISLMPDRDAREDALSEWEYGNTIRRDNSLIPAVAAIFNVTDEEVIEIFRAGATM